MADTWMTHGTEARIYDEPSGRNWDTGTEKIGMTWKSWNWQSYRVMNYGKSPFLIGKSTNGHFCFPFS
jgi:hypothetical protein